MAFPSTVTSFSSLQDSVAASTNKTRYENPWQQIPPSTIRLVTLAPTVWGFSPLKETSSFSVQSNSKTRQRMEKALNPTDGMIYWKPSFVLWIEQIKCLQNTAHVPANGLIGY